MIISWYLLVSAKAQSGNLLSASVLANYQCLGHSFPGVGGTFWVVGEATVRALAAYHFPGSEQLAGLQLVLTSL